MAAFLAESGFGACAAVAVLYTPELPALLLPPDLLLPYLDQIFEGYGGVRFIFGCRGLSPDPEIVPGAIAQFDHTARLRFVRQCP
ncbi:MAG: hypothetical protein JWO82_3738 [Akkermansiaceae bacterium]|nr:hypothetical protein [Akkermansiaceae bacterium]